MMTDFAYEAINPAGTLVNGRIAARDEQTANEKLQKKRLAVVSLKPSESAVPEKQAIESFFAKRLSHKQLSLFTRQLSTLVAVMPLEEALQTLMAQAEKNAAILEDIHVKVVEGYKLSTALAQQPKSFSPLYISMVAAGEASGGLAKVLENLADLLDRQAKTRSALLAALAYPSALALVALAVIIAMMTLVVPKLVEQFDTMGQSLPWLTTAVITVSNLLVHYGWLILTVAVVSGLVAVRALRQPQVKARFDAFLLRLPFIGTILKRVAAAQLARTLSVMLENGLPVVDGLAATAKTAQNSQIRRAYQEVMRDIGEGSTISAALKRTGLCPPLLINMAASGEQSGRLAVLLDRAGETLEREFDTATTTALSLLEPAIIVLMGGAVTIIVLAILLPILQLNVLAIG
ncbi:MAG: type II secretion system inner membrane protein GspF [Sphingomonadales bacterium]